MDGRMRIGYSSILLVNLLQQIVGDTLNIIVTKTIGKLTQEAPLVILSLGAKHSY